MRSTIVAIVEVEHAEGEPLDALAIVVAQRVRHLASDGLTTGDAAAVAVPGVTAADCAAALRSMAGARNE